MTLLEVVRKLSSFDQEGTIYVEQPWRQDSASLVAREPEGGGLRLEAEGTAFSYFLEVFVARELLEGLAAELGREPTVAEKAARLIEYAVNDA